MSEINPQRRPSGLPMALGAYLIWGLLPLYLRAVHTVPPVELVAMRIIFTVPLCLLFVLARGQVRDLVSALTNRAVLLRLIASAALIATNWVIYVFAIAEGHVYAASLGYYINPLVNVAAGTVLLGERLNPKQWLAVILAAAGVSLLLWGAREMLVISLSLAVSFSAYGLVRKLTPVGSLPGLTIESLVLLPFAIATAWWYAVSPTGSSFGHDAWLSLLIVLSGVLTAVPLLLFAVAARRMAFSALGMVQFFSPSLVFVIGLTVFGEPLRPVQLACFLLIWVAIALFVWDLLAGARQAQRKA